MKSIVLYILLIIFMEASSLTNVPASKVRDDAYSNEFNIQIKKYMDSIKLKDDTIIKLSLQISDRATELKIKNYKLKQQLKTKRNEKH